MQPNHPSLHQGDAAAKLAAVMRARGWIVEVEPKYEYLQPDLVAVHGGLKYAVELKSLKEGRADRAVALLSQAILQACRYANELSARPLAVLHVGDASPSLWSRLEQFQRDYAPDVSIGLLSDSGDSHFIGEGLEALNFQSERMFKQGMSAPIRKSSELFSDLNQWMLKVILSPELPPGLLNAPRQEYQSATNLAEAAQVSVMSASRFIRRLREEGFLDDGARSLRLVRRRELFNRWKSASMRSCPEIGMSYLLPGSRSAQLREAAENLDACVGLFAAADLLNLGHVRGVASHLYVRRLSASSLPSESLLVPASPKDEVQVIVRQANFPESIFRGAEMLGGTRVSDALQIWLDASSHPARGFEQAEYLERKVLSEMLELDA